MPNKENRFNLFIKHSLIGGLTVLLPIVIVLFLLHWLYKTLSSVVAPITRIITSVLPISNFEANFIMLVLIIVLCFVLGNFVSTRAGNWLWRNVEGWMIKRIPGYRMVRDLVVQLVGDNNKATRRGEVAILWLYGRDEDISVMGIVTARHQDGRVTVFMPCGPNPTTGFVYHADSSLVDLCPDIKAEQLMKMVIACGAGSQPLLKQATAGRAPAATPHKAAAENPSSP